MGFFIIMPITRRGRSPSCFTQLLAAVLPPALQRIEDADGVRLRSGLEARSTVHRGLVRGATLSVLIAAGCSGEAGDLFPSVRPGSDGSESPSGSGGSSLGGGASSTGGGDAPLTSGGTAGRSGVDPVGAGANSGLGSAGAAGLSGAGSAPGGASGGSGSSSASGGAANAGSSGAASSGGAVSASGGSGPACDPCPCGAGPFGEPEPVLGLGVPVESFGPAPSPDGLTLFFSAVDAEEDILFTTRSTRANAFGAAAPVPGVNRADSNEGTPFLSFDQRSLYFFSDRVGPGTQGDRDLWVAQATGSGVAFGAPAVVPEVNGEGLEHLPRASSDGLTLMFVSSRTTTSGGSNIFEAERDSLDAPFGTPVELPGVNSDARDEGFWLSQDLLTVYFASNRDAAAGMDIWVAQRPARSSAFGAPENLAVVNTDGMELDPAITSDGFELFFASDRSGTMQLYRSVRECPQGGSP
jgi:hypothetical protein